MRFLNIGVALALLLASLTFVTRTSELAQAAQGSSNTLKTGSETMAAAVLRHLQAIKDYQDLSAIYEKNRANAAWLKSDEGTAVSDQLDRLRADAAATDFVKGPEGRALQYSIGGKKVTDAGIVAADLDESESYRETIADAIAQNIVSNPFSPKAQAALAAFRAVQGPYEAGLAAVKRQDWKLAVESFLIAQAADPYAPRILFNLGLASEKIPGNELRAIAWFQAYLLAAPAAPDATVVRAEVARLESAFESGNRAILRQIDAFFSVAKKNIGQLAPTANPQWGPAATSLLGWAAEQQASSHYLIGDEAGALSVLHVADEKIFHRGRILLPAPGSAADLGNIYLPAAMASAGFGVEEIVNPKKFGADGASLDYLLETGDLAHGWTYLKGWKPDDLWMMGVERFLCTVHDRSDGVMLDNALGEMKKKLSRMDDARGYDDLIRLLLEMGELDRAKALASAVPEDLDLRTLKRYGFPKAGQLIADFNEGRIQSRGACPAKPSILTATASGGAQTLQWGEGTWGGVTPSNLWWLTGRLAFLTDVGRRGLGDVQPPGVETRLGGYFKEVSDNVIAKPYEIAIWTQELARVEYYLSATYRQVRGPIRP